MKDKKQYNLKYNIVLKDNDKFILASCPTREFAESYLQEMLKTDEELAKIYNWSRKPEYKIIEQEIETDDEKRRCSECKKEMSEGYCIENGEEYYCSDECLHKHYTESEYLEMYDDGNGDSYWTQWED